MENKNRNTKLSTEEKLQIAMGLKQAPSGFEIGISQEFLSKWRMFFRGKENNLIGVDILADYLDKRQVANGNRLPDRLGIINNEPEKKFFINYIEELTSPENEDEDKSAYIEEFQLLGIDFAAKRFPVEVSKGLEFFGKIFGDLGMADCEENQRAGIFMSALGAEGSKVWQQGEQAIAKIAGINIPKAMFNIPEIKSSEEYESFEEENEESAKKGGQLNINEQTETSSEMKIDEEDEEETTETTPEEQAKTTEQAKQPEQKLKTPPTIPAQPTDKTPKIPT
ncbi:MAG: hypothetical protein WC269_04475, partial [Candidatus Gracilibacteria bacterium]